MLDERVYTIPLRRAKSAPRWKRSKRAILEIRLFLLRHTKAEGIILDSSINEKIWERGAKKPPSKIRVKVAENEDGIIEAKLVEGES